MTTSAGRFSSRSSTPSTSRTKTRIKTSRVVLGVLLTPILVLLWIQIRHSTQLSVNEYFLELPAPKDHGVSANEKKPPPPRVENRVSDNQKKPPPPTYSAESYAECTLLQPNDYIYKYGPWDGAPVVVEKYKLVFFTVPKVGSTGFKQLFRRMEGFSDYNSDKHPLPHAPKRNGLVYLYDFPPFVAEKIMTDPSWTRAIFVREPKERVLSGYLDKATQNHYIQFHCCPDQRSDDPLLFKKLDCAHPREHAGPLTANKDETPLLSFSDFAKVLVEACPDPHWEPQANRVDDKYLQYINFVGDFAHLERDTKNMLERIHAWDEHGKHGWPNGPIFASGATHATHASKHIDQHFTTEIEMALDGMLEREYNHILTLRKHQEGSEKEIPIPVSTNVVSWTGKKDLKKFMLAYFDEGNIVCDIDDGTRLLNISFSCKYLFENSVLGSGNFMAGLYAIRVAARVKGNFDVSITCPDASAHMSSLILPWITGFFPASDSTSLPVELKSKVPDTCGNIDRCPIGMMFPEIQYDLRRMAVALVGVPNESHPTAPTVKSWLSSNQGQPGLNKMQLPFPDVDKPPIYQDVELDDAIIHFRCGDLMSSEHPQFGFLNFHGYARDVSPDARRIGIVTQPFGKKSQSRDWDKDFITRKRCRLVVLDFVRFLEETFPSATVRVHSEESIALTYARMVMANQTITAISTFGVFPAIANFGEGYVRRPDAGKRTTAEESKSATNQWLLNPPLDGIVPGLTLFAEPEIIMVKKVKELWEEDDGESKILAWFRNSTPAALESKENDEKGRGRCSCANSDAECCDRKVLRAHKMGVVLIRNLFHELGIRSEVIHPSVVPESARTDYRHVVVTRSWYDSIVSGFLYHKSGRECWLDQNGETRLRNKTFEWESHLSHPISPAKNRTLCEFLADEPEDVGMRVYVDFALSRLYAGILPYRQLVLGSNDQRNHTLFVCYEELSHPDKQRATFKRVVDWLYPGGHQFSPPRRLPNAYIGGHSTTKDMAVRERLRGLARKYDTELFDGAAASANALLGCGEDEVPSLSGEELKGNSVVPAATSDKKSDFMSSCLLIMDDNHWLTEWIAFHYTTASLRYIIVAIDPRSKTSPVQILDRWKGRIEFELWNDTTFEFEGHHETLQEANLARQQRFIARCMQRHKNLGHAWVMFTDTDEFVAINKRVKQIDHELYVPNAPRLDKPGSVLKFLNQEKKQRGTVCLSMGRLQLSPDEPLPEDVHGRVPAYLNAQDFLTLRWLYAAADLVGPKNIVDVSSVPFSLIPQDETYQHRVIDDLCPEAGHTWHRNNSLLQVYHYLGTLEQYEFRDDARLYLKGGDGRNNRFTRFRGQGSERIEDAGQWLDVFLTIVDAKEAARLLEGVGRIDGWESVVHDNPVTFFSRARCDRSGAAIMDMLLAHAYGFAHNMTYGGACADTRLPYRASTEKLIRSVGLDDVLGYACPANDTHGSAQILDRNIYAANFAARSMRWFTQSYLKHLHSQVNYSRADSDCKVAVHIRRGDVSPCSSVSNRYLPNSHFLSIMDEYIPKELPTCIFSESNSAELWDDFVGHSVHLDEDLHLAWKAIMNADYIVLSKSSFSLVPAILNRNAKVFYTPFLYNNLKGWEVVNDRILMNTEKQVANLSRNCSEPEYNMNCRAKNGCKYLYPVRFSRSLPIHHQAAAYRQLYGSPNRTFHANWVRCVSDKHDWTYVHVRKAGGNTIYEMARSLEHHCDDVQVMGSVPVKRLYERIGEREFLGEMNQMVNGTFLFSFVRDPVSRFCSAMGQIARKKAKHLQAVNCLSGNATDDMKCVLRQLNRGELVNQHLTPAYIELLQMSLGHDDVKVAIMPLDNMNEFIKSMGVHQPIHSNLATDSPYHQDLLDKDMIRDVCLVYEADVLMMKSLGMSVPECDGYATTLQHEQRDGEPTRIIETGKKGSTKKFAGVKVFLYDAGHQALRIVEMEAVDAKWKTKTSFSDLLSLSPDLHAPGHATKSSLSGRVVVLWHAVPKTAGTTVRNAVFKHIQDTCPTAGNDGTQQGAFAHASRLNGLISKCNKTHYFGLGGRQRYQQNDKSQSGVSIVHLIPFRPFDSWAESAVNQIVKRRGVDACKTISKKLDTCDSIAELSFEQYTKEQLRFTVQSSLSNKDIAIMYDFQDTSALYKRTQEDFGIPTLKLEANNTDRSPETCAPSVLQKFHACFAHKL